jgi:undecaprenyl pyrophosphate phosphatase UppP
MDWILKLDEKIKKGSRRIKILWWIVIAFLILLIVGALWRQEWLQNLYSLWKNVGIPILWASLLIELSLILNKTNGILTKIANNLTSNRAKNDE